MSTRQYDNALDLITFSRASGGTALRKIAYGSELVTNGTFDTDLSGWTDVSTGTGTVAFDAGTALLTTTDTNNRGILTQSFTTIVGSVYECSIEITEDSGNTFSRIGTTPNGDQLSVLQNPSVGVSTLIFVATSTTTYVTLNVSSGSMNFDNISVKEVLFDQGDLTLFNHPADVPRIEYDANGNVLGLLVEEQRTNLLTYSEDFSNASWAAFGTKTITQAAGISPDNSLTATYLASPGNNGMQSTITVSASTAYMFSVFAKADVSSSLRVSYATIGGTTANGVFDFEISTGVDVGNGWYRCSVTFTTDVGNTSAVIRIQSGVVSQGIYIWGAQFEAGAFPTSYIPTSGSTATRAADVASIPVSAFGYNQSKGTVVIDVASINGFTFGSIGDGTFENDLRLGASGANTVRGTGSGFAKSVTNGSYNYETGKIAIAIEEDNYYTAKNGIGAAGVDTSASLPPNPQRLNIGSDYTNFQNGHIKSIKYYPRRLTNAQIVELTS